MEVDDGKTKHGSRGFDGDAWADLRPKKCMNKKCSCSFVLNPDSLGVLEVNAPKEVPVQEPTIEIMDQIRKPNSGRRGK